MKVDLTHIEAVESEWTGRVVFGIPDGLCSDSSEFFCKDLGFMCGTELRNGNIDEDTASEDLDKKLNQLFDDMDIDTQAAENFCLITIGDDENLSEVYAVVRSRLIECGAIEVKYE